MADKEQLGQAIGVAPGRVVAGRYRISRVLGLGGMGLVTVADDLLLRKPVAMKVLLPEVSSKPEYIERFQREVALAHSVTHPNIARTFDLGASDGLHFFTMEFLEGKPFDEHLSEVGRLTSQETRQLALVLLDALEAAHNAGIVHRDLKPANLMLVKDARRLVIMDFGISGVVGTADGAIEVPEEPSETAEDRLAEALLPPGHQEADWSVTSAGMGSPPFMPPEQWMKEKAGPASDLYSLGCILYQCVTGKMPFKGTSLYYYLNAHLNEMPTGPRLLDASVPADLDAAIMRCLQKDPAARYQSAREMADALRPSTAFSRWAAYAAKGLVTGLVLALFGWALVTYQEAVLVKEMRPAVSRLAALVAHEIAPEDLDAIHSVNDAEGPRFARVHQVLQDTLATNPDVRFLYVFRAIDGDGLFEFVVDADPMLIDQDGDGDVDDDDRAFDPDAGGYPGEAYDGSGFDALVATLTEMRPLSDDDFTRDGWGVILSGYAPIGDQSGAGGYLVGVDADNATMVMLRKFVLALCLISWLALMVFYRFQDVRRARIEAARLG